MTSSTNTVFSSVLYRDAFRALDWLESVLGFERGTVIEGPGGLVAHAEMWLGEGVLQVGSHQNDREGRPTLDVGPALTYIRVPDVVVAAQRASAAGADVLQPVMDGPSGLNFILKDPEGSLWAVGNYCPDRP
jgi:uncharacterized glyoxalase superfamily protein PhnB